MKEKMQKKLNAKQLFVFKSIWASLLEVSIGAFMHTQYHPWLFMDCVYFLLSSNLQQFLPCLHVMVSANVLASTVLRLHCSDM